MSNCIHCIDHYNNESVLSIIALEYQYIEKKKNCHLIIELEDFMKMNHKYSIICNFNPDFINMTSLKKFNVLFSKYAQKYISKNPHYIKIRKEEFNVFNVWKRHDMQEYITLANHYVQIFPVLIKEAIFFNQKLIIYEASFSEHENNEFNELRAKMESVRKWKACDMKIFIKIAKKIKNFCTIIKIQIMVQMK